MLEVQVILREGIKNWSIRFNSVSSNKVPPFSSIKSLKSRVQLFATPRTVARQASLFITNFPSLLKLMSIELVMPSNHLIFCHTRYPPKAYVTRLLLTPKSPFWMKGSLEVYPWEQLNWRYLCSWTLESWRWWE